MRSTRPPKKGTTSAVSRALPMDGADWGMLNTAHSIVICAGSPNISRRALNPCFCMRSTKSSASGSCASGVRKVSSPLSMLYPLRGNMFA